MQKYLKGAIHIVAVIPHKIPQWNLKWYLQLCGVHHLHILLLLNDYMTLWKNMAWLLSAMTEFITFVRAVVMQIFYEGKMFTKRPVFCEEKKREIFSLLLVRSTESCQSWSEGISHCPQHSRGTSGESAMQGFRRLFGPLSKQVWKVKQPPRVLQEGEKCNYGPVLEARLCGQQQVADYINC